MTPATLTLTAEQKTFFHAHGPLVLPVLPTPDEVARSVACPISAGPIRTARAASSGTQPGGPS